MNKFCLRVNRIYKFIILGFSIFLVNNLHSQEIKRPAIKYKSDFIGLTLETSHGGREFFSLGGSYIRSYKSRRSNMINWSLSAELVRGYDKIDYNLGFKSTSNVAITYKSLLGSGLGLSIIQFRNLSLIMPELSFNYFSLLNVYISPSFVVGNSNEQNSFNIGLRLAINKSPFLFTSMVGKW